MKHTSGPWRQGKIGGVVVSDTPLETIRVSDTGHEDTKYYGGYLIAESILKESDKNLIIAAPELLASCENALAYIEELDKQGIGTWEGLEALYNVIQKAKGVE